MSRLHRLQIEPLIVKAIEEDWGYGDWTTNLCIPDGLLTTAKIVAKSALVVAGTDIVDTVFTIVDPQIRWQWLVKEGDRVGPSTDLVRIHGEAKSILRAERVALNFFARMCGIATLTRRYVDELSGTNVQLLDTRKTTPCLRIIEKTATVIGGARNHRFGLCDGVILKENHIAAAGGITRAVQRLRESLPPTLKIEVEATCLDEVQQAVDAGADLIMLDNMSLSEMSLAVRTVQKKVYLEASGNITLENIRDVAKTGVDFISTGAVIHQACWSDLSLLIEHGLS